ncbi:FGGY family carbohydrate kinase [Gordonia jinhuaensis]|uniref:ATP:glycerol 3-phosphotransferase n=1 Tax=Gordonia jinhuaensis TaxID=1517702 RepID=A0A916T635_9ACTN|nr:carbohydrate kinase [Gordonia jinhuaensis]
MTISAVLAIDQGTSATKAVVTDQAGQILAEASAPIRPHYPEEAVAEQDPEELWTSVLTAGREAVRRAQAPVDAVALANQGESILVWDRATSRPLSTIIGWQDRRATEICTELSDAAEALRQSTGLVLDPYFSAPKMGWARRHLSQQGVVTTTDTWLVHRLCGAFVTDASTASRSLLTSLSSTGWDQASVDLFGLTDEELPTIVGCDEIVGTTSAFGPDIPLGGLIVDQQAALLAQACVNAGDAKCTYGTGAFLLANAGQHPVISPSGLTTSVAWQLRGQPSYCLDGQVYTAASAVRWAIDLGLIDSARDIDAVAAHTSDGVVFVPAFAGLAAPWWDPAATACLRGMTLSTGRGEIIRALVEGIAAQVAVLTALVAAELPTPPTRLRVDGGLTGSAALMQAQADLLGIPVEVHSSADATGLGAAACLRLALDASATVDQIVRPSPPSRVYEPRWSREHAAEVLSRWQAAAATTMP